MRKVKGLSVLFLCALQTMVMAQKIDLGSIDTSGYPILRAEFYAFDQYHRQVTDLNISHFTINEGRQSCKVSKVNNPNYPAPPRISLLFAIDISGSMYGQNLPLAKSAANHLIDQISLSINEVAVTSFDTKTYVNSDFSQDPTRLHKAIDDLESQGGTSYQAALNAPVIGGLDLLAKSNNKRVLIILTDGVGDANQAEIIAKAKQLDVQIYSIVLNMDAPLVLKEISKASNGKVFENISSKQQASKAYTDALFLAQGIKPSTVEWISNPSCSQKRTINIAVDTLGIVKSLPSITYPISSVKRVTAMDPEFLMQRVIPDVLNDTFTYITALNDDFTIDSYNTTSTSFKLLNKFPLKLKKGIPTKLHLRYNATVREMETTDYTLYTDQCLPLKFNVSNGLTNNSNIELKVEAPDGGETFYAGMDTVIRWSGVFKRDNIELSLVDESSNKSTIIKNSSNGLRDHWHIPNLEGDQFKIKASMQISTDTAKTHTVFKTMNPTGYVTTECDISPTNEEAICWDMNNYFIVNLMTGNAFGPKPVPAKHMNATYNDDGTKIYFYRYNQPTVVYNSRTFRKIGELPAFKALKYGTGGLQFIEHRSNTYVFTSVPLKFFHIETGKKVGKSFYKGGESIIGGDSEVLVSFSKTSGNIKLWDRSTSDAILSIKTSLNPEYYAEGYLTADHKYVLVYSGKNFGRTTQTIHTYSLETGDLVYSFDHTNWDWGSISNGGNNLVFETGDKFHFKFSASNSYVLHIPTGKLQNISIDKSFGEKNYMSDDGSLVLSLSSNFMKALSVFPSSFRTISDESDRTFSIKKPTLSCKPLSLGEVSVGSVKDTLVRSAISNPNSITVKINQIILSKNPALKLVGNRTDFFTPANNTRSVEIRLSPKTKGSITGYYHIISSIGDTVSCPISAKAIAPSIQATTHDIHLGQIKVGKTIDTTVTIINNKGKKLIFDSIGFIGANLNQIKLIQTKGFTLKKGESKDVRMLFSPTLRGLTTSSVQLFTSQTTEPLTSTIIAEGLAPRAYIVRITTLNKLTKQPIMAWVTFPEHHSFQEKVPTTWTTDEGIETVKVKADREYTFKATLKGYISDSVYLDLRTPPGADTIDLLLQVTPIENVTMDKQAVLVSGELRNMETKQLLSGSIDCYLKDSLISTIKVSRGTYNMVLSANMTYQFIAQSNDYLPTSATLSTFTEPTEYQQDFLLSQVIAGQDIQLDNVLFDRGKAKLLSSSYDALDMLVKYLVDHSDSKIELSGHTDNQGNKKMNLQLSKDRVATIQNYLVSKGIDGVRISGTGYGDTKPIASNAGEKTRKLNRRVEFKIVK